MNPIEKTLSLAYWVKLKEIFGTRNDDSDEEQALEMFMKLTFSTQSGIIMWINSIGKDQVHFKVIPLFQKVRTKLFSIHHLDLCLTREKDKCNPFRIHLKTQPNEQNMVSHTLTFTTDKSFNRALLREHVEKLIKKISEQNV